MSNTIHTIQDLFLPHFSWVGPELFRLDFILLQIYSGVNTFGSPTVTQHVDSAESSSLLLHSITT